MSAMVCIDPNRCRRGTRGHVTGPLFVDINGYAFPHSTWDDFVVIVMGWWLSAVLPDAHRYAANVRLQFMDGSYHIEICDSTSEHVLKCFSNDRLVRTETRFSMNSLRDSCLESARLLVRHCQSRNWSDGDIDHLAALCQL